MRSLPGLRGTILLDKVSNPLSYQSAALKYQSVLTGIIAQLVSDLLTTVDIVNHVSGSGWL